MELLKQKNLIQTSSWLLLVRLLSLASGSICPLRKALVIVFPVPEVFFFAYRPAVDFLAFQIVDYHFRFSVIQVFHFYLQAEFLDMGFG
jgi:hypothetical protein